MTLIARTLELVRGETLTADASVLDSYTDQAQVATWARADVAKLVTTGVIQGNNNGRLNPKGTMTRAEMAVALYRALNLK
jgi:hypothetical protein